MTLNRKKKLSYFQSCRTDIQGGLNCLQGCFRKQTGRGAFKLVVVAPLTNKLAHFFATPFFG